MGFNNCHDLEWIVVVFRMEDCDPQDTVESTNDASMQ